MTNSSPSWLFEEPTPQEKELELIAGLKTLLTLLKDSEVTNFKFALELSLIQPVQSDDELLIIPEIKKHNEASTEFLERTSNVPTIKRYLQYFKVKLLEPSSVKFRGNLLGKTAALEGHAVFIEKKELIRIVEKVLGMDFSKVISEEIFVPKFPELVQPPVDEA
ncbi:MAG: hypothetical protein ABIM99_03095 [Candidatus Dojkabacteria bacterium]